MRKSPEAAALRALEKIPQLDHPKDVRDLIRICRSFGVSVFEENDLPDDVSGMLFFRDGRYIILVNGGHSETRKRFTIAHELGHYMLHKTTLDLFHGTDDDAFYRNSESSSGEMRQEREANKFAANLLMPAEIFKREFRNRGDFGYLGEYFGVSPEAAMWRAKNLGLR